MPGRNLEHDWSRMGMQGQQKDDEVYGKGNLSAYKYRMEDTRINRFFSVDPMHGKFPHYSDYSFSGNRLIDSKELEGLEESHYTMQLDKAFSNAASAQKWQKDNEPLRPFAIAVTGAMVIATVGLVAPEATPAVWRGMAMLTNPTNQQIIVGVGGLTASLIDPNPANDYPGGLDDLARAGKVLFKNSVGAERFVFNGNRLNFFFGRGTGSVENVRKSMQRLSDFKQLGIEETEQGIGKLTSYMDKALGAPATGGKVNSVSGRFEVFKSVDVVEGDVTKGSIQFGFSYADKSMKGTPEVMTAIPKTKQ